MLFVF